MSRESRRWTGNVMRLGRLLVAVSLINCLLIVERTGSLFGQEQEPLGLDSVSHPADNKPTPAKIALGKQLFFDKRLSSDGKVSCATCHDPNRAFGGAERFSPGVENRRGNRHSPTLINVAFQKAQFWDGRATSLEKQVLWPLQSAEEMNMPLYLAVQRLKGIEGYRSQFKTVFGKEVSGDSLMKALAAYERSLLSGNAPYDRYQEGDDNHGMSASALRGMEIYFYKANCKECHPPPNFTNNKFHNIGIVSKDVGRITVTKQKPDDNAFKTPTLRDIALSAPYMHDGSLTTLEEVVTHYNQGGKPHPTLDVDMVPLKLTDTEQVDLIAFLKEGLTGKTRPDPTPPQLPK